MPESTDSNKDFIELKNICIATLKVLPAAFNDPNNPTPIRELPNAVNKVVDIFEEISSTTQLPTGKNIFDLPWHVARLFRELQVLRALQKPTP